MTSGSLWTLTTISFAWTLLGFLKVHAYRFADHVVPTDDNNSTDPVGMTLLADVPPPPLPTPDEKTLEKFREDYDFWSSLSPYSRSIIDSYWDPLDGFGTSASDETQSQLDTVDDGAGVVVVQPISTFTYGEVTFLGVQQLAYAMLDPASDLPNQEDSIVDSNKAVFYDLGSGVGRLVTQLYLEHFDRFHHVVGVELSEQRHAMAEQSLQSLVQQWEYWKESSESMEVSSSVGSSTAAPSEDFPIQLRQGDALQFDLSDATHIFMSSLCFPLNVLVQLQHKIAALPQVEVVAALNRLDVLLTPMNQNDAIPSDDPTNNNVPAWMERLVPIQMTWGPGLAYIYHRRVS